MKKLLLISVLMLPLPVLAQTQVKDTIPLRYIPQEFKRDEPKVKEYILSLEKDPFGGDAAEREFKYKYVYDWLENCQYTRVNVYPTFFGSLLEPVKYEYADLLSSTFVFGKGLYFIETDAGAQEYKANLRGVEGMITVYKKIIAMNPRLKHSLIEGYIRLQKEGRLEAFVKERTEKALKDLENQPAEQD